MKTFKRFYLWAMYAKFYMGIYFVALVLITSAMQYMYGQSVLPIHVLLQMFGVSIVLSLFQAAILNDTVDYGRGIFFTRTIVWLSASVALIVGVAHVGGWLEGLPAIALWGLGILMIFGLGAMLIGLKWEQDKDTVRLNQALKKKQANK